MIETEDMGQGFAPCPQEDVTENGSVLGDIRQFGEYLSERYTPTALTMEVSEKYGREYIARFGLKDAMESHLSRISGGLGLSIVQEDIARMASAIVDRGDITY